MYKKLSALLLSFILLISFFSFTTVNALSCANPFDVPIEERFERYDYVLIGEVLSIEQKENNRVLKVKVNETLKNIVDKEEISVYESVMWGESKEGLTYVFYLNKNGLNQLEHPLCSPTSSSSEQIAKAKEYAEGTPVPMPSVNIKEEGKDPQPNERVNKEETKEDNEGEDEDKSGAKELVIFSIICLSLAVCTSIYFLTRNKK